MAPVIHPKTVVVGDMTAIRIIRPRDLGIIVSDMAPTYPEGPEDILAVEYTVRVELPKRMIRPGCTVEMTVDRRWVEEKQTGS